MKASRKVHPFRDKQQILERADNSIREFMKETFSGQHTCNERHPRMQIFRKATALLDTLWSLDVTANEFQEGVNALRNIGTTASFSHPLLNDNPSFLGSIYNFFSDFMIFSNSREHENEAIFEDEEERDNPVCFEAQSDTISPLFNAWLDPDGQGKDLY